MYGKNKNTYMSRMLCDTNKRSYIYIYIVFVYLHILFMICMLDFTSGSGSDLSWLVLFVMTFQFIVNVLVLFISSSDFLSVQAFCLYIYILLFVSELSPIPCPVERIQHIAVLSSGLSLTAGTKKWFPSLLHLENTSRKPHT